ncbi:MULTISPECIES: hypothetical protein [Paenibacillus]|uniref:hypothetical protein n=1 Tax=Paenibacillus TaxID=44249 RepID=UPI0013053F47|nr:MULTISPECIES: hypothetical protein [Paenibacillus]
MNTFAVFYRKAKSRYHRVMRAYHLILYRDCTDARIRSELLRRAERHERMME